MMGVLAVAFAQAPVERVFPPVRTPAGDGAVVDWTHGTVVVTASSRRAGSEGTEAVEELARRAVDDRVRPAALQVPLEPGRALGDLAAVPELWSAIEPRLGRWVETENRYFTSGTVEVVGTLSLVEALKPWTMASAGVAAGDRTAHTGALLDARGTRASPCYAPVIVGPNGPLHDGRLALDAASTRSPAVWVQDGADPATDRAGANALTGRVASAEGCRIVLDGPLADAFAELAAGPALSEGALVIVVGS